MHSNLIHIMESKILGCQNTHEEIFVHPKRVARADYLIALSYKAFSFSVIPDILGIQIIQTSVCLPK